MNLTDYEMRRRRILLAVIESFIETALPVGSKAVSAISRLGLSAATIRNVMAELEEEGYLTHPHPSAGRIPTANGYRFYVDQLNPSERLSETQKTLIEEAFRHSELMETVMGNIARILCDLTDQVAVVLCPHAGSSTLRKIELIPVKGEKILVVVVTHTGLIRNAMVHLAGELQKEELAQISRFLSTELTGLSLSEVHEALSYRLLEERSTFFYICKRAKEIIEKSGLMEGEGELYLEGTRRLLDKPEFRDHDRVQSLLALLEEKRGLYGILKRDATSEELHVYIDSEVGDERIRGCTLITSGYRLGERSFGTLGVIGPTRLNYGRVIPIIHYIAFRMRGWVNG